MAFKRRPNSEINTQQHHSQFWTLHSSTSLNLRDMGGNVWFGASLKILGLVVCLCILPLTCCISVEDDLSLSYAEGEILDQFTTKMKAKLTEEYMEEPIYLIRWLRSTNFNIEVAEQKLVNNIKWRKENKIDHLDDENWKYFEENFAYSLDVVNKAGNPVLTTDSSRWDVRQAVVSGQKDKLVRWMIKMMEDATKKVREFESEGRNVTRWGMIYNLGYFNLLTAGCFQCLSVYTEFVINYEKYYPLTVDKITLINTPGIFEVVLRVIRPLLSPKTKDLLVVYGTNKKQWQQALLNDIDVDSLPLEYGGSKIRNNID